MKKESEKATVNDLPGVKAVHWPKLGLTVIVDREKTKKKPRAEKKKKPTHWAWKK